MSASRRFGFVAGVLTASCVIWSTQTDGAKLKRVTHDLGGMTGRTLLTSTDGCSPCHAQALLTLGVHGPQSLFPGENGIYTFGVNNFSAPDALVGIDVASTDAGSLSLVDGEPTQLISNEITHTSSPKMLIDGVAFYSVRFTMPAGAAANSLHRLAATLAVQNVGWAFVPYVNIVTASVPTPAGISAPSVGATTASLTWTGTSPQFRVLRKNGLNATFSGATDATATLVYEGDAAGASATGLTPATDYTFAAYGKAGSGDLYSSSYAAVSIRTLVAGGSGVHFYVATSGNDTNPGTAASPFRTVTKGLSMAIPGDVVNVAAGTYNGDSGEVFPIVLPSGVWLLGASAPATILDASGSNKRVLECLGDSRTLLSGFTIRGGFAKAISTETAIGGGIYSKAGDATTITRNIITNNLVEGHDFNGSKGGDAHGGGMYIAGSPVVTNNLISSNGAHGIYAYEMEGGDAAGAGLYVSGTPTLMNNTIVRNTALPAYGASVRGEGRGAGAFGGFHVNTIFAFNEVPWEPGGLPFAGALQDGAASYCLFFLNYPYDGTTGTDAVMADPQFANYYAGDYHPLGSSPAKGAGTTVNAPTIDLDGRARPSPPAIGAYEPTLPLTTTTIQSSANPSTVDQNVTFTATVTSTTPGTISGSITFRDGSSALATMTVASGTAAFSTASLAAGDHAITAEYSGSVTYAGSTSSPLTQTVNLPPFGTPANFSATANGTSQVLISWAAVAGATSYEVQRATSNGNFSTIASPAAAGHTDGSVNADTTYLYRVRAIGSSISAFTPVDIATTVVFADDPLSAGTVVKAMHITKLRTAVSAVRIAAGLGGGSYTDQTLTAGSMIRSIHITELRAALDEARAALGFATGGYTDPAITAGSTVAKTVHIVEIRERVK